MRIGRILHSHQSRLLITGLFLLSFCAAPALAMELTEYALSLFQTDSHSSVISSSSGAWLLHEATVPTGSPVTLKTAVHIASLNTREVGQSVLLAGLSTHPTEAADALALSWEPADEASWFGPVWSLKLKSRRGLLTGDIERDASGIELARVAPVAGHVYQALLSYHPRSGELSLAVVDLTDDRPISRLSRTAARWDSSIVAVAGYYAEPATRLETDTLPVHVEAFAWTPHFLPVGTRWTVGTPAASGDLVPVRRFTTADPIWVALDPIPVSSEGAIRLSAVTPTPASPHALAILPPLDPQVALQLPEGDATAILHHAPDGKLHVEIPANTLPWGSHTLLLEFMDGATHVLLYDVQTIAVGELTAVMPPLFVDAGNRQLTGELTLSADAPEVAVDVALTAHLTPLEWQADTKSYVQGASHTLPILEQRVMLHDGSTTLAFVVPYPDTSPPGLWQVSLEPRIEPDADVPVTVANNTQRLFSTYPSADPNEAGPVRLVMLPDTQNATKAHPHVFTRQTQWIAAHARELHIGAVLHVGDIVDNNDVQQWERAAQSLGVLDGVVPYVLAVGNHDVRVAYTPERSLFNREVPLLNLHFPVERALVHSNLGGTFETGRLENSYSLFSFGGEPYLVLSLEWGPRDEVLDWANGVLAQHRDHKVILITHGFTAPDGGWVTRDRFPVAFPSPDDFVPAPSSVNDARQIWEKLVDPHDHVVLVLSGHMGMDAIPHRVRRSSEGNTIVEIMANYQSESNGGNGWLVLLTLSDEHIAVNAFSPYLCAHRFDFDGRGFWHNFTIDLETGIARPLGRDLVGSCTF